MASGTARQGAEISVTSWAAPAGPISSDLNGRRSVPLRTVNARDRTSRVPSRFGFFHWRASSRHVSRPPFRTGMRMGPWLERWLRACAEMRCLQLENGERISNPSVQERIGNPFYENVQVISARALSREHGHALATGAVNRTATRRDGISYHATSDLL